MNAWSNLGLGTGGNANYIMPFRLKHFLPGMFDPDQKYFRVAN